MAPNVANVEGQESDQMRPRFFEVFQKKQRKGEVIPSILVGWFDLDGGTKKFGGLLVIFLEMADKTEVDAGISEVRIQGQGSLKKDFGKAVIPTPNFDQASAIPRLFEIRIVLQGPMDALFRLLQVATDHRPDPLVVFIDSLRERGRPCGRRAGAKGSSLLWLGGGLGAGGRLGRAEPGQKKSEKNP